MFSNSKGFASFSVDDIPKAKAFYIDVLGLQVSEDDGLLNLHIAGSTPTLVYPKDTGHSPATYTVLNFPVDTIEPIVDALTERGVQFEQYGGDIQTNAKGIWRTDSFAQAWFKDPAGNIFSLMETTA